MSVQSLLDDAKDIASLDPIERMKFFADKASQLSLEPALQKEEHRIKGCTAKVYLLSAPQEGQSGQDSKENSKHIVFKGYADAKIINGFLALLFEHLNNLPPQDILDVPDDLGAQMGLSQSSLPTRANTYATLIAVMKQAAKALLS